MTSSCSLLFRTSIPIAAHARWDDDARTCALSLFAEQQEAERFGKTLVNLEAATFFALVTAQLKSKTQVSSLHLEGAEIGLFVNGLMAYYEQCSDKIPAMEPGRRFLGSFAPPIEGMPCGGVLMWSDPVRSSNTVVITYSRQQALKALLNVPWQEDTDQLARNIWQWNMPDGSDRKEVWVNGIFASLLCGVMAALEKRRMPAEYALA